MTTPEKFDFARVRIGDYAWVVQCDQPVDYQLGRTYRRFELAMTRPAAAVFHAEKAREIEAGLRRLFPTVAIEPATFAEWIEQQAEPADRGNVQH